MLYYHIPPFTQPWICDLAYVSLSIYLSHENSFFTHSHFLCTAASLFGSVTSAVQTNGMCVRWTGQVRLVSSHLSFFNASYGYAYLCLASQVLWFIHYYLLLLSQGPNKNRRNHSYFKRKCIYITGLFLRSCSDFSSRSARSTK